jgi:hypothetical protein
MLLTDNALPLTLTYARHDSLGVYVRFGDGKIASYTTYGWGGVYYLPNAFVGGGPGSFISTHTRAGAQAFDVYPWALDDLQLDQISGLMAMTQADILASISTVYDCKRGVFRNSACMITEWFSGSNEPVATPGFPA